MLFFTCPDEPERWKEQIDGLLQYLIDLKVTT
jgi:hypothetical protein